MVGSRPAASLQGKKLTAPPKHVVLVIFILLLQISLMFINPISPLSVISMSLHQFLFNSHNNVFLLCRNVVLRPHQRQFPAEGENLLPPFIYRCGGDAVPATRMYMTLVTH